MGQERVFVYYTDPGHGWLKVSKALLEKLDILDKISDWSYVNKNHYYLEEDCDVGILINALQSHKIVYSVKVHQSNRYSRIRNYMHVGFDRHKNTHNIGCITE